MKRMAQAVARMLRLPPPQDWPLADAQREWGPRTPIAMGSNSRVRADRARKVLGWRPHRPDVLHDIEFGSYAAAPVAA